MEKKEQSEKKLVALRGEIISASINLENHINYIIQFRYFRKPNIPFCLEVLCDPHFGFGLKINIMEKAFPKIDKSILENIRRMNNIRNYFAHSTETFVMADKEGKPQKLSALYTDKKRIGKELNFRELYDEFFEVEKKVIPELQQAIIEMGGKIKPLDLVKK